ncbi:hypothetical protein, unlikely [Trypanosoma brucei gambiense DAL972]|uniref:Uncharacterized protein n=1 Tax=Trypanosoma brucei gambiense (strain MHOM/CI/86/DAL972) TaxID=679716 RepID=C9ZPG9_TRYB9|nr:hypothetical protein, unlikely [Trypanosoma brucei gambiense DAL972]CBH11297.1 hypothetical protein, unlikely [Trypanosoma brucei gambiense DAL972]|eukprot:XP_011773584.1 hypothetical protein, unlikely [Trypanosoma brucei gambiense DAL972]
MKGKKIRCMLYPYHSIPPSLSLFSLYISCFYSPTRIWLHKYTGVGREIRQNVTTRKKSIRIVQFFFCFKFLFCLYFSFVLLLFSPFAPLLKYTFIPFYHSLRKSYE